MNECEALCNRLAIIADGVIKCIGNVQYLKNRYGQGFTVIVKLRNSENTNVKILKKNIERQFAPDIVLKDEHKVTNHDFSIVFYIFVQIQIVAIFKFKMLYLNFD